MMMWPGGRWITGALMCEHGRPAASCSGAGVEVRLLLVAAVIVVHAAAGHVEDVVVGLVVDGLRR